jgi:hypothetical protein
MNEGRAFRFIWRQIVLTPWNWTKSFEHCHQGKNYDRMSLKGLGDPTGCGEGFSYLTERQTKKDKRKVSQSRQTLCLLDSEDDDIRRAAFGIQKMMSRHDVFWIQKMMSDVMPVGFHEKCLLFLLQKYNVHIELILPFHCLAFPCLLFGLSCLACLALSFPVLSCPVLPRLALALSFSCPALPCLFFHTSSVLFCLFVLPYLALPCLALPCLTFSCFASCVARPALSCPGLSCPVLSRLA